LWRNRTFAFGAHTQTSEFGGYVTQPREKAALLLEFGAHCDPVVGRGPYRGGGQPAFIDTLISAICSLAAQEADLTDHHGIRITSGGEAAAGLFPRPRTRLRGAAARRQGAPGVSDRAPRVPVSPSWATRSTPFGRDEGGIALAPRVNTARGCIRCPQRGSVTAWAFGGTPYRDLRRSAP